MVAHIFPNDDGVHSSPANVRHHQIRGHARNNPHLILPSRAETDRLFMMSNAPHTTVPLRFDNMMKAYLPPVDPDEFNAVYSEDAITTIWEAFKDAISPPSNSKKGKGKKGNGKKGKKGEEVQDDPVQDARVQDQVKEDPATEKNVSEAWRKVYNEKTLCPGYLLNISETRADKTDPKKYKIDGALISTTDEKLVVKGRPNFFLDDLTIEFKRGGTDRDAWDDRAKKDMEPDANTRTGVRGQLMSYGERVYFYQHRTGLFMLLVNGGEFRVIRWDRSGCIVTEAVNYVDNVEGTKNLLEFLYAYSKATPEQRGFDPTATRLSKDSCGWQWMQKIAADNLRDLDYEDETDIQLLPQGFVTEPTHDAPLSSLFATNILTDNPASEDGFGDLSTPGATSAITPVFKYVRALFRKSLEKTQLCYSLKVCGGDYLVGEPVFAPQGLIGRGTRGYVALEWKTQRLVFLKDAWRPFYEGVDQEGTTLAALNAASVPYVPTLVCHEDVGGGQETEASQYSSTGSKKRDVFGEKKMQDVFSEKESRPIAPLPRSHSKGSVSGASTTQKTRQSSGGSNGTPRTPTSSGSNGGLSTGHVTDAGSAGKGSGGRNAKRSLLEDTANMQTPGKDGFGLRHLTHYRIVVAEVCLPSTDIQSGEQLLKVILNCLLGHQDAFVKCGVLHRDISSGNILIRPTVICINPETGESAVVWYGLLCDWELAKVLPKDDTKPKARQPHRTGTWYYMSVYSLTCPSLPLSLADELESFLHVMIYLAVRFLRTSALDVKEFVESYFEGFEMRDNQLTCSLLKRMVVRNGSLEWKDKRIHFVSKGEVQPVDQGEQPQTDAEYLSPLNDVIATFLAYFEARYAILDYEGPAATKVLKPIPSLQSEIDAAISSSAARKRQIKLAGRMKMGIPDFSNSNAHNVPTPGAKGRTKPPQSVYDLAAMLKTHEAVIRLLAQASDATQIWPSGDYAGDQLKGYIPLNLQSTMNRIRLQMRSTLMSIPEGRELAMRPHTAG